MPKSGPLHHGLLGQYPDVALAEARERHNTARKRLANGIDPMAERMAEKTAVKVATEHTFEKIAELWLEHWRGNKSARHSATTQNRLQANVAGRPSAPPLRGYAPALPATTPSQHGEERKTFQQLSVIMVVVEGKKSLTPDTCTPSLGIDQLRKSSRWSHLENDREENGTHAPGEEVHTIPYGVRLEVTCPRPARFVNYGVACADDNHQH